MVAGVTSSVFAQQSRKPLIEVSGQVDMKSLHYWRGGVSGGVGSIEPSVTASMGNFSATLWGGYTLDSKYREIDLLLTYTLKNLSITFADYYNPAAGANFIERPFNLKSSSTIHLLEGIVEYTVSDRLPLHFTAGVLFYGADKDEKGNDNYSTYLEASYPFSLGQFDFSTFVGMTPFKGLYADELAVVNTGVKAGHTFQLNDKLSLPVSTTVLANPYKENAYWRFSIGLTF